MGTDRRLIDSCCKEVGKKRVSTRADLMEYRSWGYFHFMTNLKGSVFPELIPWLLFYGVVAVALAATHHYIYDISITDTTHKLLLFPIAFLLVFRSNTAYARFWEGAGHFRTFDFALRELTRRTFTFIKDTSDETGPDMKAQALRQNVMRMLMVLSITVRQNLRKRTGGADAHAEGMDAVQPYLTDNEHAEYDGQVKNRPLLVMSWIGKYVHEAHLEGKLDGGIVLMGFDDNISKCLQGWMGMNKICFQPLPFPYLHLVHWLVLLWCLSLPLALLRPLGWGSSVISPLIATALYAIEEVAEEIEDPFGDDLNDLPTESFEIGLRRDARMVLAGPGPGTRGQDFASVGEFGVDFSLPLDDLEENESKPTPISHVWQDDCQCESCSMKAASSASPTRAGKRIKSKQKLRNM